MAVVSRCGRWVVGGVGFGVAFAFLLTGLDAMLGNDQDGSWLAAGAKNFAVGVVIGVVIVGYESVRDHKRAASPVDASGKGDPP
jgi:hypothetical protein